VAIGEFIWERGAGVSDIAASATSSENWLGFGSHNEVLDTDQCKVFRGTRGTKQNDNTRVPRIGLSDS
jgi:hypothetical protein